MNEQALQRIEPEEHSELVPYQPPQSPSLFGTADPVEVVARASRVAASLKEVIKAQGLISKIQGKEYPRCEAWTLLGTMLGVFPVLVWSRPVEGGWEARVEARTKDGAIVGAAEAQCLKTERNWRDRDDFALRSMAQTRATAKALRMPLGFVMTLGGFQATPAEEMDFEQKQPLQRQQPTQKPSTVTGTAKSLGSEPGEPSGHQLQLKWRKWLVEQLHKLDPPSTAKGEADGGWTWQYFLEKQWIGPEENLEDMLLAQMPVTLAKAQELLTEVQNWIATRKAENAAEPPQKPAATAKTEPAHQSEDWYQFVLPFGKDKGRMMGELDKKTLFGWWANFEVEHEYKGKPKEPETIEQDKRFREMLDQAGAFYKFEEPA